MGMLKFVFLLALGAVCAAQGAQFEKDGTRTADMEFLQRQKKIFELLLFVRQNDLSDAEFYDIGRNYNLESNIDLYNNKNSVQQFLRYYNKGFSLNSKALFSLYNPENLYEMKQLFELFYSAKDFQTFYNTACWARVNMNDGVFVAAFTIAVFYRNDCKYMRLPAMYEIYPNLYYSLNVIQEVQNLKISRGCNASFGYENKEKYIIRTNANIPLADELSKMDYFMEDPSMNAYYYYFRQIFSFWLSSDYVGMSKELRGKLYYYNHQQLMAKYYLERMSNGLGEIEDLDWYKPISPGYYSNMMYSNGIVEPHSNHYSPIPFYKSKYHNQCDASSVITRVECLQALTGYEYRILEAIDSGYLLDAEGKKVNIDSPEGLYLLANVIEGNADSCNKKYYGMYDALARNILGFSFKYQNRNQMIPSSLQCYSTSMRDRAFYSLYKKIMSYFLRYKEYQPMYSQAELQFEGIKINWVHLDTVHLDTAHRHRENLNTYFENCDTIINNAVSVENFKRGQSLKMMARRFCLNYEPFFYRLGINSDKQSKAIIKIFLGPYFEEERRDFYYLYKYYKYFFEMDRFEVDLSAGDNRIIRKSSDSMLTMPDMMPMDQFMDKLNTAISYKEPFEYSERQFGFSSRFTLPKGSPQGIKYKMFFFISPYEQNNASYYELPFFGKFLNDGKAPGFPLDRPLYGWNYDITNMFFKDVIIYNNPMPRRP